MMLDDIQDGTNNRQYALKDDFSDFLEHSLCGFITTDAEGKIIQVNTRVVEWTGHSKSELAGMRFSDLLTIGGKIYYETHLGPLLRMRGFFDEVALELACLTGERQAVFANAYERRNENGEPLLIRITVFKAVDRKKYEQTLKQNKLDAEIKLVNTKASLVSANADLQNEQLIAGVREQFIAVLGHDLRNPLSSIMSGASLLAKMSDDKQQAIIGVISRSAARMAELIDNIMDFARARMGSGIMVNRKSVETEPILQQIVDEMRSAWPGREIETQFNITEPVNCDGPRMAQLLSNLLANALTHGAPDTPVIVRAFHKNGYFEMSVSNQGIPIPETAMEKLFQPFTREGKRASQNGLGLGLFIAAEIARGHGAEMTVSSDEHEPRFTFSLKTSSTD